MPSTLLDPRRPAAPRAAASRAQPPAWVGRVVRSLGVSAATTLLSLIILTVLVTAGMGAAPANVLATVAGIGPSYSWNRRFAWRRTDRSHGRMVAAFWGMCVTALLASTAAVAWAEGALHHAGWTGIGATGAILTANVATFGSLWVLQFLVLDRVIFGSRGSASRGPGRAA